MFMKKTNLRTSMSTTKLKTTLNNLGINNLLSIQHKFSVSVVISSQFFWQRHQVLWPMRGCFISSSPCCSFSFFASMYCCSCSRVLFGSNIWCMAWDHILVRFLTNFQKNRCQTYSTSHANVDAFIMIWNANQKWRHTIFSTR